MHQALLAPRRQAGERELDLLWCGWGLRISLDAYFREQQQQQLLLLLVVVVVVFFFVAWLI